MFLVKAFEILPCPPYYFPVSVFIIVPLSVDTPSSGVFSSSAHGALYERSSPGMDGVGRPERHHPVASSRTARRPSPPLLPPNKPVTTVISVSMSVANREFSGGLPNATPRSLQNNTQIRWVFAGLRRALTERVCEGGIF